MAEHLNQILDKLPRLTDSDDVRWLLCYVGVKAHYPVNIRGIGYHGYGLSIHLNEIAALVDGLEEIDLVTLYKTLNLVYEGLRPKIEDARGVVEIKTVVREYAEIDWDTTLPLLDEQGNPVMMPFSYSYVYIRLYAGKGDADRRRKKLLSVYADEGMGHGGTGGYVAAALDKGLITEDQILDAYHGSNYGAFIQECRTLLTVTPPSGESANAQEQTPVDTANKASAGKQRSTTRTARAVQKPKPGRRRGAD